MKKINIKVFMEEDTAFLVEVVKNDKNVKGKIQRYTVDNSDGGEEEKLGDDVTTDSNETTKKRYGKNYTKEKKW